jgi:hypothetical protein
VRAPPQRAWLGEIVERYGDRLVESWPHMLGLAAAALFAGLLWNRLVREGRGEPRAFERWASLALVLALVGLGLSQALDAPTCFDDAYISLRYADNLVRGEGLVWNPGERVEGYTNFLWTLLLAAGMAATPLEGPLVAVGLALLSFVLNLFVVWRIGLLIAPPVCAESEGARRRSFAFPIAVALLAVQNTFTDYATTGLETAFASLLVNLGLLALIRGPRPNPDVPARGKHELLAGLCWILATLTRPDHALFYVVGSAVVLGVWIGPLWSARREGPQAMWRAGLRPMAAYAAPFLLWLGYAAWKLSYYGRLLPNTYYAKSAYASYWEQGLVYLSSFHLAAHLWLVLPVIVLAWVLRPPRSSAGRRFVAFVAPAVLAYELYVARVGGDFMFGRFYVSLLPLFYLAGEQAVHLLGRPRGEADEAPTRRAPLPWPALLAAAILAASAGGLRLLDHRELRWHLTEESGFYPIVAWSPIEIDHSNYRVGLITGDIREQLGPRIEAGGLPEPTLASGAIGLLGYYSRMRLIDRLGLTEPPVAHQRLERRGRPGHDKWAPGGYLRRRGTHFVRGGRHPRWMHEHARIVWGPRVGGRNWYIVTYDRKLMAAIKAAHPPVRFEAVEPMIDAYLRSLPRREPEAVRSRYGFWRRYYFDHNDDRERERGFEIYFAWIEAGRSPAALNRDLEWRRYLERLDGGPAPEAPRSLRRLDVD